MGKTLSIIFLVLVVFNVVLSAPATNDKKLTTTTPKKGSGVESENDGTKKIENGIQVPPEGEMSGSKIATQKKGTKKMVPTNTNQIGTGVKSELTSKTGTKSSATDVKDKVKTQTPDAGSKSSSSGITGTKGKIPDTRGNKSSPPDGTGSKMNKPASAAAGVIINSTLLKMAEMKWGSCGGWISNELKEDHKFGPLKVCTSSSNDEVLRMLCLKVVGASLRICTSKDGLESDFLETAVVERYMDRENKNTNLCSKIKDLKDESVTAAFKEFPEFKQLKTEDTCNKICIGEKENYGVCAFAYILVKALEDHSESQYQHMIKKTIHGVLVDEGNTDTDIKKSHLSRAIVKYTEMKCSFPSADMYPLLKACDSPQANDVITDNCITVLDSALAVCTGKAKGKDSIFLTKDVANQYLYNKGGKFDVCKELLANERILSHSFNVDGPENVWYAEMINGKGCENFCKVKDKDGGVKNSSPCVVMYLLARAISDGTVGYVFNKAPNEGQIGEGKLEKSSTSAKTTMAVKSSKPSSEGTKKVGKSLKGTKKIDVALENRVLSGDLISTKVKKTMLSIASRDWKKSKCLFPSADLRRPEGPLGDCDVISKEGVIPQMCDSFIHVSKIVCDTDIQGRKSLYLQDDIVKAYLNHSADDMAICQMFKAHLDSFVQESFKNHFSFWNSLVSKSCKKVCVTQKSNEKTSNNPICVLFYLLLKGIQDGEHDYNETKKYLNKNGVLVRKQEGNEESKPDVVGRGKVATKTNSVENGLNKPGKITGMKTDKTDLIKDGKKKVTGNNDNKEADNANIVDSTDKEKTDKKGGNRKTGTKNEEKPTLKVGEKDTKNKFVDTDRQGETSVKMNKGPKQPVEGEKKKYGTIKQQDLTDRLKAGSTYDLKDKAATVPVEKGKKKIATKMNQIDKSKQGLGNAVNKAVTTVKTIPSTMKKPVLKSAKTPKKEARLPSYNYGEYDNEADKDKMLRPEERGRPADFDQSKWSPSNSKPIRGTKYKGPGIPVAPSGHFMAYFVTAVILCILCYVTFHNKKKILAFVIEGRQAAGARRRTTSGSSAKGDYKLLDQKSDVLPHSDLDPASSTKNYIY